MIIKLTTKIRCDSIYNGKSKIEFVNMIGVGDVLEVTYELNSANYRSNNFVTVKNLTHNVVWCPYSMELLKYLGKIDHEEL